MYALPILEHQHAVRCSGPWRSAVKETGEEQTVLPLGASLPLAAIVVVVGASEIGGGGAEDA